jgi:hypothetical protein
MAPPIIEITKTFFLLAVQHIPQPIRGYLFGIYVLISIPIVRLARSKPAQTFISIIPARLLRPLAWFTIFIVASVLLLVPLAVSKSPGFYCYPHAQSDPHFKYFGTPEPSCCRGPMDTQLRLGVGCAKADTSKLQTVVGQDLSVCGLGYQPACCSNLVGLQLTFLNFFFVLFKDESLGVLCNLFNGALGANDTSFCVNSTTHPKLRDRD